MGILKKEINVWKNINKRLLLQMKNMKNYQLIKKLFQRIEKMGMSILWNKEKNGNY